MILGSGCVCGSCVRASRGKGLGWHCRIRHAGPASKSVAAGAGKVHRALAGASIQSQLHRTRRLSAPTSESDCTARLGRGTIRLDVCDRFVIENSMVVDRRSFADPQPVLFAILRHPASWPMVVRADQTASPGMTPSWRPRSGPAAEDAHLSLFCAHEADAVMTQWPLRTAEIRTHLPICFVTA